MSINRRRFLKQSATAGLLAGATACRKGGAAATAEAQGDQAVQQHQRAVRQRLEHVGQAFGGGGFGSGPAPGQVVPAHPPAVNGGQLPADPQAVRVPPAGRGRVSDVPGQDDVQHSQGPVVRRRGDV